MWVGDGTAAGGLLPGDEQAPVYVVANRGPLHPARPPRDGTASQARLAGGGLVTALVAVARQTPIWWIAVEAADANGAQDGAQDGYRTVPTHPGSVRARSLCVPRGAYRQYYERISNGLLWPLQHGMPRADGEGGARHVAADDERAWEQGYLAVNRAVAEAIIADIRRLDAARQRRAVVLLQDYHLYCVAGMLRPALPWLALAHFVHIPWPEVRCWRTLPPGYAAQILGGLLHNHVVGLQTTRDVGNFVACVVDCFPDALAEPAPRGAYLTWRGRRVLAGAFPIAIDPAQTRAMAAEAARTARTTRHAGAGFGAQERHERQVILRVDRMEPSKNVARGIEAFALLLERHPEMRERVCFVMLLPPGRARSPGQRAYQRRVRDLVTTVNERFATKRRPVVVARYGHDRVRALAALREFDVLLANSVAEGMHLVTKEGVLVNRRDGVVVLSRTAGVYAELADGGCLGIAPADIEETAEALFIALSMPPTARRAMARSARRTVASRTVMDWWREQMADIASMAGGAEAE